MHIWTYVWTCEEPTVCVYSVFDKVMHVSVCIMYVSVCRCIYVPMCGLAKNLLCVYTAFVIR